MRKSIRVAVATAVMATLALFQVSPAEAGVPETFPFELTVEDTNACTGEAQTVSLSFTITVHDDGQGAEVLTIKSTATTSTGWAGTGTETQVATPNGVLLNNANIRQTNGSGGIITVKGLRKINLATGEVTGGLRFTCVRP